MKKWLIGCLTVLAMVCLIPGIVLKAAAETVPVHCLRCGSRETREILRYEKYDSNYHKVYVTECQNCHNDGNVTLLQVHTGGTQGPTCTKGKICEKCGAEYGAFSVTTGARGRLTTPATARTPADASAATQKRLEAAAAATRPATLWECAILAEGVTTAVTHGASGHPPATARTPAAARTTAAKLRMKAAAAAPERSPAPREKPVKNAARNTAFSVTTGTRGRLTATARTPAAARAATQKRPKAAAAAPERSPASQEKSVKNAARNTAFSVTTGARGRPLAT